MNQLTQDQVNLIAVQVVNSINTPLQQSNPALNKQTFSAPNPTSGKGVFETINSAVEAARTAHNRLMLMTVEKRDEIIANIRRKMLQYGEELAVMAQEETGLGRAEDKVLKNKLVTEKTPGTEILRPGAYTGDRGLTLIEKAPYGVIGAITPCTNPTSTIICNTIAMVASGNAVVFNTHPTAKNVSIFNIELLNQAVTEVGGPQNLVTTIKEPTIESAQELMHHKGIELLVVTGGGEVVKAAMASGKRAVCAGPGNPPVVVDESADIENAARHIVKGGSMDNNIICVVEKEIFVVDSVADSLLSAFQRYNAVILKPHEIEQLEKVIFSEIKGLRQPARMEKKFIGKNIKFILSKIGKQVDDRIKLAVAPVELSHPLVWTEQMMPVIPLVRMPNVDQAIDVAKEAEHGFKHTAVMHSKNLDNLSRMARVMNCSIFVKNGPSLAGLGYGGEGYCSFTIASPTGEGLTSPLSFTRERRCVLVDHFRIV